jgi:hypothetical protein
MKVNRKKKVIKKKGYEIVKLENEVIISKLSLEWTRDDQMIGMVV